MYVLCMCYVPNKKGEIVEKDSMQIIEKINGGQDSYINILTILIHILPLDSFVNEFQMESFI